MADSESVNLPSIPQPLRWEGLVKVELPDPVLQLAKDLHADRQLVGLFAATVAALCVFALLVRRKEGK